jgi:hypothetical protein
MGPQGPPGSIGPVGYRGPTVSILSHVFYELDIFCSSITYFLLKPGYAQ